MSAIILPPNVTFVCVATTLCFLSSFKISSKINPNLFQYYHITFLYITRNFDLSLYNRESTCFLWVKNLLPSLYHIKLGGSIRLFADINCIGNGCKYNNNDISPEAEHRSYNSQVTKGSVYFFTVGCEWHNYPFQMSRNVKTNAERKIVTMLHFFSVYWMQTLIGITNALATYGFRKMYRHEFERSQVRILTHGFFYL